MKSFICMAVLAAIASAAAAQPITYAPMQAVGQLEDPRITESSGLAASLLFPGQLWTHNDSGDGPRLFRFTPDGSVTAVVHLDIPPPRDWEDIASFRWNGRPMLLVGDIGDNKAQHEFITLWLLEEQAWDGGDIQLVRDPVRIDLRYPDGPHNCESLAVDPATGQVLLMTKLAKRQGLLAPGAVYGFDLAAALEQVAAADEAGEGGEGGAVAMERLASLPLNITVAADLSLDGLRCVVATYGDARVWTRGDAETWATAFARPGQEVDLEHRGQSESICYGHDGQTLWLTAEGLHSPVWRVSPLE